MCDVRAVIKRILVRCPTTKKLNVTGVVIEEDAFCGGESEGWNRDVLTLW